MAFFRTHYFVVIAGFTLTACAPGDNADTAPAGDQTITIYTADQIYTGVDGAEKAEAIATQNGEIIAVGTRTIIEESAGPNADIIDLGDAAIYPGFTDAHAHLLGIGMRENYAQSGRRGVDRRAWLKSFAQRRKRRLPAKLFMAAVGLKPIGPRRVFQTGRTLIPYRRTTPLFFAAQTDMPPWSTATPWNKRE